MTVLRFMLIALLTLIFVGCSSESVPLTLVSTPNIEATVEARLAKERLIEARIESEVEERLAQIVAELPQNVEPRSVESTAEPTATAEAVAAEVSINKDHPVPASSSESESQTTAPSGVIAVGDILAEFENNAIGAVSKYSGNNLTISGQVETVDYDVFGSPYISVGTGALVGIYTVWCMLTDPSLASQMNIGDNVTVTGSFDDWNGMYVNLSNCAPEGMIASPQTQTTEGIPCSEDDNFTVKGTASGFPDGTRVIGRIGYENIVSANLVAGFYQLVLDLCGSSFENEYMQFQVGAQTAEQEVIVMKGATVTRALTVP